MTKVVLDSSVDTLLLGSTNLQLFALYLQHDDLNNIDLCYIWERGRNIQYMPLAFVEDGLSNGPLDVDSIFYCTHKSSAIEAFDIHFNGHGTRLGSLRCSNLMQRLQSLVFFVCR
ncbi:hypothetical protein Taro_022671 [Colocasia esculenta]|uniref:Uncharacterized protein n=1 Tax=Colocasia esculenta TaxID=4460 RepID=A0A843V608_COLES|nr:hypothetical protein [Colocasia esculenta]